MCLLQYSVQKESTETCLNLPYGPTKHCNKNCNLFHAVIGQWPCWISEKLDAFHQLTMFGCKFNFYNDSFSVIFDILIYRYQNHCKCDGGRKYLALEIRILVPILALHLTFCVMLDKLSHFQNHVHVILINEKIRQDIL